MKVRSLIPLIIYLVIVSGIGYYFIPSIVSDQPLIFGGVYTGIVLGWFFYWLGILMTKPRDRKGEVKKSYYYPLFLFTVGYLIYSYMLIPVVADEVQWMFMAFIGGLVLFAAFYIAGMIVAHRDMQGKDVYFTQLEFLLACLFVVPTSIIALLVCYFSRNNSTGLLIGTSAGIVFGAIFFYLGIALASEDAPKKTGLYKFLIWLLLWAVPAAVMMALTPIIVEINMGNIFALWVSFLSILLSFLVFYTIAVFITKKVYQTKASRSA